jgi:transposase
MMVYRWIQLQRDESASAPAQTQQLANWTTQSMAPRHLAWLFLRTPSQLEKQEKQTLALIRKA